MFMRNEQEVGYGFSNISDKSCIFTSTLTCPRQGKPEQDNLGVGQVGSIL